MSRDNITIYETPGRHITAICGNSGIFYPFYCSLGKNSFSPGTWLPWMGYFLQNPNDPRQIYMAKPEAQKGISPEIEQIMTKFLSAEVAYNLIYRMGNDEAVALSLSFGKGVWKAVPELKQAIKELETVKKYLKVFHYQKTTSKILISSEQQRLVAFEGKQGRFEKIDPVVVAVAKAMEAIIIETYKKFKAEGKLISLNVQDEQAFPSNDKVAQTYVQIPEQSKYCRKLRFLYAKQIAKFYPEVGLRGASHGLPSSTDQDNEPNPKP